MHSYLIDLLVCPACRGELGWVVGEEVGGRVETAEARCAACGTTYPVREGIGLFLTPDLPREDLWAEADSRLGQVLEQNPDMARQLLKQPLEGLGPADQFFRAMALEERGDFDGARAAGEAAMQGLYTADYLACWQSQVDYLLARLAETSGPVVDLASGRDYLVERMVRDTSRQVVATDFSPRILRRNKRWLEHLGLYERVSLLAFDARRTPFKDGAVGVMTTNLGLPNIAEPAVLLAELRRIVGGVFLGVSYFYPEEDAVHRTALSEAGLDALLFESSTRVLFDVAALALEVANRCDGQARPTPKGEVLAGAGIDGFPVAETRLTWVVLLGRRKK